MRIRRCAAQLLGSAYSVAPTLVAAASIDLPLQTPPPQLHQAPCAMIESLGWGGFASHAPASGETCELNQNPWSLVAELDRSDPQVQDDLMDKYSVPATCSLGWLLKASMTAASEKELAAAGEARREACKAPKKVAMSKVKVKKEKPKSKKEEGKVIRARVWLCKKNDGKNWRCQNRVREPGTLCDYHFYQKRSLLNPEFVAPAAPVPGPTLKPSTKPQTKKPDNDSAGTDGFYYYTMFGPFHSKRQRRSSTDDYVAPKQEDKEDSSAPEDAAPASQDQGDMEAKNDDAFSGEDIVLVAGGDEESSDDDGPGASPRNIDCNGGPRAGNGNGDMKAKNGSKRGRKPVKARSLMSLM